jgi:hypothetical protein
MANIKRGKRWAICKYMDQRMWPPEDGGWRARSYEVAVRGTQSAASHGSDLPPLLLIVQIVDAIDRCGQSHQIRLQARAISRGRRPCLSSKRASRYYKQCYLD